MSSVQRPQLDADASWRLVVDSAALQAGRVYESLVQQRHYRIDSVEKLRIVIKRLDRNAKKETLSAREVRSAIHRLNTAGGVLKRGKLFGNVAKEATLVWLHPQLAWSADEGSVEVIQDERIYPDEVPDVAGYIEGATKSVNVNVYERSRVARSMCIAHHGLTCQVCGIDFSRVYGAIGAGFIHVHHLKPLSELTGTYEVDPINDLCPVCPNCHGMLHRRTPPLSISELQEMIRNAASMGPPRTSASSM